MEMHYYYGAIIQSNMDVTELVAQSIINSSFVFYPTDDIASFRKKCSLDLRVFFLYAVRPTSYS